MTTVRKRTQGIDGADLGEGTQKNPGRVRKSTQDNDTSEGVRELSEFRQEAMQLELFEPDRIARPDYNVGRYAGWIFISPYSKEVREVRRYPFIKMVGEKEIDAEIVITPAKDHKTPTTTTLRVFLGFIQIWQNQERPEDGKILFSMRQLAHVIGWKWNGGLTAKRLREHMEILSKTSIDWIFSFSDGDDGITTIKQDFRLIDGARHVERRFMNGLTDERFSQVQSVVLQHDLVKNMLAGKVRPINYEVFRGISNDTSANLYTMLDLWMAKRDVMRRRAFKLLTDDLGLEGERNKQKKHRKAWLQRFVRDLDGRDLVNGKLALSIEETADKKDYNLIARKVRRLAPRDRSYVKKINDRETAEIIAADIMETIKRHGSSGKLNTDYVIWLCERYPQDILHDAVSRAKSDYQGNVKKTLGHVFVYELKTIVQSHSTLTWYQDAPRKR